MALIGRLEADGRLSREEWIRLLEHLAAEAAGTAGRSGIAEPPGAGKYLKDRARAVSRRTFGNQIYTRGLIEFTGFCRNDCYYCGLRAGNRNASRYRLTKEQILDCCREGYELGFRTFVLQGGEDPALDDMLTETVADIRRGFPDCAITLSAGERPREIYRRWREAGADRYLLRHETADPGHYRTLHPPGMTAENRKRCLEDLKELGYQIGAGFMVGSPGQTAAHLAEDFLYLEKLQPHMVGIGPFVPHHETPFSGEPAGTAEMTLRCVSLLRLMLPEALLPATTALGTIDPEGREKGILAGANVVMPNLSPREVREKYELYDNKICTGEEAAECRSCLELRMLSIGYELAVSRGDHPEMAGKEDQTTGRKKKCTI